MNLTSGLERWDPYSLWGVASFGLLLGGTLLVTVVRPLHFAGQGRLELLGVASFGTLLRLLLLMAACPRCGRHAFTTACFAPHPPHRACMPRLSLPPVACSPPLFL